MAGPRQVSSWPALRSILRPARLTLWGPGSFAIPRALALAPGPRAQVAAVPRYAGLRRAAADLWLRAEQPSSARARHGACGRYATAARAADTRSGGGGRARPQGAVRRPLTPRPVAAGGGQGLARLGPAGGCLGAGHAVPCGARPTFGSGPSPLLKARARRATAWPNSTAYRCFGLRAQGPSGCALGLPCAGHYLLVTAGTAKHAAGSLRTLGICSEQTPAIALGFGPAAAAPASRPGSALPSRLRAKDSSFAYSQPARRS